MAFAKRCGTACVSLGYECASRETRRTPEFSSVEPATEEVIHCLVTTVQARVAVASSATQLRGPATSCRLVFAMWGSLRHRRDEPHICVPEIARFSLPG